MSRPAPASQRLLSLASLALAVAALSACGGGDDLQAPERVAAASAANRATTSASGAAAATAHAMAATSNSMAGASTSSQALAAKVPKVPIETVTESVSGPTTSFEQSATVTGSLQRIVRPSAKADTQGLAQTATQAVSSSDVLAEATSESLLNRQTWDYQCYGQSMAASTMPVVGIVGSELANAPRLRMGLERPDSTATRTGIVLRTSMNDPFTGGAPRCEISFTRGNRSYLPKASTFWYATTLWLDDWTSTGDEQLVTQFHDSDWNLGLSPFFALYLKGSQARFAIRWDYGTSITRSKTSTTGTNIWSGTFDFSRRWVTLVVQGKTSTNNADGPFVRVWLDGKLLADYHGPFGYNQPTLQDYAKLGYYHWTSGNAWNAGVPVRTMYVGKARIVNDPSGKYSEPVIRSSVQ